MTYVCGRFWPKLHGKMDVKMNTVKFEALSDNQQHEQLDQLVQRSCAAWGFADASMAMVSYTNNAVYRVQTDDADLVLRVHRPGHKQPQWITSERQWLNFLAQQSDLRVPEPVADLYAGELDGVDGPVYCDLLRWLDGAAMTLDELTDAQIEAIGHFAARLHDQTFDPPADFKRPALDWEGLFGERSPYHAGAGERLFTTEQRQVIAEVTDVVQTVMDDLGKGDDAYGMIHADLLPKNVLFDDAGAMNVVDFDDCARGYYLYDLAPMLWASRHHVRYEAIQEALWRGYTSERPQDQQQRDYLEAFVAARHVASCRWIAGNTGHPAIRGKAPQIIAERVEEMRVFLQTGTLSKQVAG
jgi:Ser/Thr protein kinase RdoA (MazF antagonist)